MLSFSAVATEALALMTAGAASFAAVEAYRTRRIAEGNDRTLHGDEDTNWPGLVERQEEQREALRREGLL